jgi:hypothetical protein
LDVRFGSKADIGLPSVDVRFTPKSGHQLSALGCPLCANRRHRGLFDHLIGATDQWQRHCDTQVFGGLEVDDQFDFRGLLDWHFGRLLPMEDAAGVNAHLPIRIGKISPVANQAAPRGERTKLVDRGHRVADGQRAEVFGSAIKERVTANNERACLLLGQVPKYGIDVAVGAGIQDLQLQSDCAGRRLHIFRYGGGHERDRLG